MWCYVRLVIALIFALDISGLNLEPSELIIADIIKNITHINNVLKDLLENYKQLKISTEAKENSDNGLSTETESESVPESETSHIKYRNVHPDNRERFHPVTQMILLDENYQDDISDKSNERSSTKEWQQSSSLESIEIETINTKTKTDTENFYSKNDTFRFEHNPDKSKNINPEMLIIGTALNYLQNNLPNFEDTKLQTRFTEVSNILPKERRFAKEVNLIRENDSIDRGMKAILRSNNYNAISIPKQVSQRSENELFFRNLFLKERTRKNPDHNTLLVIVTSKNNKQNIPAIQYNPFQFYTKNEEDETLIVDHLKTTTLRDAYGTACLKVAVRRCYKTLLQVQKIVCGGEFNCKDSFKEHFRSNSKTGCIKEFNINEKELKINIPEKHQHKLMKKSNVVLDNINDDIFKDITRTTNSSFYDLCLPIMMPAITNDGNQEVLQKKQPRDLNRTLPINILRDRYEKECRRMSRDKCERACEYAATKTCQEHHCERRERKEFSRSCRKECQYAFLPNGGSGSSSDSDNDSSSGSGSDIFSD